MKTVKRVPRTATGICDLADISVSAEPFPHLAHDQFIEPSYYEQLRLAFPTCPPSSGPTGFSLFWGDTEYARLLDEQPAWQSLFDTFHSQRFIDWATRQFADIWQREGCKLDLSGAQYVPYREDRIDKERATLRRIEHAPQELWVRMDIHQGRVGYQRPIHLDHARRLVSMLIYMCDSAENDMEGGELFLHAGPRQPAMKRVTPRHNLMVVFPCMQRSYHSVSKIASTAAPRNYVQVHISSSVDVWPREKNSGNWRQRLRSYSRYLPAWRRSAL